MASPILFVNSHADGAWPNDAKVRKLNSQPDDRVPSGTLGRVVGSIDVRSMNKASTFAYFVFWEVGPKVPVFVVDMNNDGTPRLELVTP